MFNRASAWTEGLAASPTNGVLGGPREAAQARVSLWRTPRTRVLLLLGTLGSAVAMIKVGAGIYVDLLWFRELGQEDVFWTTLKWKIIAGGAPGLGTASFLLLNFAIVDRVTVARARPAGLPKPLARLWRYRHLVYPLVALFGGLAISSRGSSASWQMLALWAHRSSFGVEDPTFHRDIGYFVFSLPLYQQVAAWLLQTLVLAAVCTVAAYLIAGGFEPRRPLSMARWTRVHLLLLGALLLLVLAWRLRLEQFALVAPDRDLGVPGASFTDVRIRLPTLRILMGLTVAAAGLVFYAAVQRVPHRSLVAVVAVAGLTIVVAGSLPSVIERLGVQPQALTRERPYVAKAIASTQSAFELDRVTVRPLAGTQKLTAADISENQRTLDNVPLWDADVLNATMNELESLGSYYRFANPTVDRYTANGAPRVTTVAARELDLRRLDRSARGWANERFAYTHGHGVVAVRATGTDSERYPSFEQQDFASRHNPLGLREPRIYYGARPSRSPAFLVVSSTRGEVEQPTPGMNAPTYHYDGSGGIQVSSPQRRVAFAVRFRDLKLLLSQTVTDRSRIILRRNVRERLMTLAPFLQWDVKPQTTVIGGRVTYLFHGYTTSADYPYSKRIRLSGRRVNYIREAARAAVDAFDGHVVIFAAQSPDPIMRAWQAAYPGLFLPARQMPTEMRAHLRYPQELFEAQMKVYLTYHADDPTAFWTGGDAWSEPLQLAGPVEAAGEIRFPDPERLVDPDEREESAAAEAWRMRPQYLFARLPGEVSEQFLLATPFTPRGRHNLVSYLAGWVAADGRLRLTLLSLPRDRLTLGPAQATRRILSTPAVDALLKLLNRESRDLGKAAVLRTVLGAPRLVPLGDQLVFVQPNYLSAGGDGVPRLQLVTVYANGRVGYGRDLKTALRRTLD